MADSDGVVFEGVEVDDDAVGCADFVLAAVAFADVAVVVPHDIAEFFLQFFVDFPSLFDQFGLVLQERADRDFDRCEVIWEF